jgi:hypothetical protein
MTTDNYVQQGGMAALVPTARRWWHGMSITRWWTAFASRVATRPPTLPLGRGERIVLRVSSPETSPVVASSYALYLQGDRAWSRYRWDEIIKIDWSVRTTTMSLVVLTHQRTSGRIDVPLDGSAATERLRALIHDRVRSTLVATDTDSLSTGETICLMARRESSGGGIRWIVLVGDGVDADNPRTHSELDVALARFRSRIGA